MFIDVAVHWGLRAIPGASPLLFCIVSADGKCTWRRMDYNGRMQLQSVVVSTNRQEEFLVLEFGSAPDRIYYRMTNVVDFDGIYDPGTGWPR
jgi:hypothetical protein